MAKGYVKKPNVDFDEVFTPVASIETIRFLIIIQAWELHHFDVKTAIFHGVLKEIIYVTQLEGYINKRDEHKVCSLTKALYGLR